MKKKKMISNMITYILVIAAFIAVQAMQNAKMLSSLMTGLLVPICVYVVLAISLNLVVGFLGELSLGHAAFMSAGAFAGIYFYTTAGAALPQLLAVLLAFLIGGAASAVLLLMGKGLRHRMHFAVPIAVSAIALSAVPSLSERITAWCGASAFYVVKTFVLFGLHGCMKF